MAILIDTSVLVAYSFAKDTNYRKAFDFINQLGDEKRIVVAPVLSELFYMVSIRSNYLKAIQVFAATRAAFQIEPLSDEDMIRMQAIMLQYQNVRFDFTDTAIMAVAERLKITRICTFDRRDFSVYRPQHTAYFDLLP